MNQKAFTLIELQVFVAIIGILAAVGVVAYNGYTSAAKITVVKSNLKSVTKFIQTELFKAELTGLIAQLNSSNQCIQGNAFIDNSSIQWYTRGLWAFECFKTMSNSKNPFKNSEEAFFHDAGPPAVNNVGRTNCNWLNGKQIFACYSRWGSGTNDYETSIINQP